MLNTLQTALSVVCAPISGTSYLSCLLTNFRNTVPSNEKILYLNMVGMYKSVYGFSLNDFDQLYEAIGPLHEENLVFAESLFDLDIINFNCRKIGEKLKHRFVNDIQDSLKPRVYHQLLSQSNIREWFEIDEVESLIPGNFEAYSIITKQTFLALLKSAARNSVHDILAPEYFIHDKLLNEQIIYFKNKYSHTLMPLHFSKNTAERIKLLTVCYFTEAIRNHELKQFVDFYGAGGLLFFSCLLFIEEQEKISNRNFWREYYHWLRIEDDTIRKVSQTKVYHCLQDYWEENGINYTNTPGSKRIQYVLSLRMHAIVANRPSSKTLIIKFLFRIVKESGTFLHDIEDQREILEHNLDEYTLPLIDVIDSEESWTGSLQLPRETAQAYYYTSRSSQVVDFLVPIYDYIEKSLVDQINNESSIEEISMNGVPEFLIPVIKETIREISIDEIKKLRTVFKKQIRESIRVLLDVTEQKLYLFVPACLFTDLGRNPEVEFLVYDSDEIIKTVQVVDECIGIYVTTKELILPLEIFNDNLTYQFKSGGKTLTKGKVSCSPIFDAQGSTLKFPCFIAQPVYCIAESGMIDADDLEEVSRNFLGNFGIYGAYLSDASPILIEDKLFEIGFGVGTKRAGVNIKDDIYQQVVYSCKDEIFPVIGNYPTLFLRYASDTSVLSSFKVIIDGAEFPFLLKSSNLIGDGKNESFYRIQINPFLPFPNGKLLHLRLFSLADTKDLIDETYFCLKNLNMEFSKPLYRGGEEIEIQQLEFEEQGKIFKNHNYIFPMTLQKYKLDIDGTSDSRLVIVPPVIKVEAGGESIFKRDCWFEDLLAKEAIEVSLPKGFSIISLFTLDVNEKCMHQLKRRCGNYQTGCLEELPETTNAYVMLIITIINITKQKANIPVCKVYYKVSQINTGKKDFTYIPYSQEFHYRGIKPGLKIDMSFYCSKKREYLVEFTGINRKAIISGKLDADGRFQYYQEKDLISGEYRLSISERTINRFTKKETEREVYAKTFQYESHYECPINLAILKDTNLAGVKVTHDWHTIRLHSAVKRILKMGTTPSYVQKIRLHSFFIEASFHVCSGSEFSARGFFYTKDKHRIDLDSGNLFKVKIKEILADHSIICTIYDCDGKPLRVGEQSGFINARTINRIECDCECHLFSGKIEQ